MARDMTTFSDRPSAWLERFAPVISGCRVLEIACGNGRNTRYLASLGCQVTAIDINPMTNVPENVTFIQADLESAPWPIQGQQFEIVVGINYLWRERWDVLLSNVTPNGLLVYETFTEEQSRMMGSPKNPEHFLRTGELLRMVPLTWRILAYEDGLTEKGTCVQRIAARRTLLKNMLNPDEMRVCFPR